MKELLVFTEKLSAVCGAYTISTEKYNNESLWIGSGDKRLFSSKNGRWYIGNTATMVQDSGWIRSLEHAGKNPWECSSWETFEKVGRPWQVDPGIQVTASTHDDKIRDVSVTASEEVSMIMKRAQPQALKNEPTRPVIKASTKPLPKAADSTSADAEIARMRAELAAQKRANDALSAQLSLLTDSSSETETLLIKLRQQLLQMEQQHTADNSEIDHLRSELHTKEAIIADYQHEIQDLTHKLAHHSDKPHNSDLNGKLRSWAASVLSDL
eukprot:TRINITY_DN37238_c0_g1_i1.p1 TRINITY_DN37238_c0_g1~~TRINITY_DN37238_c0_g1_i1.p1  ORF type:complete len:269 (+),score=59.54 TRINITY_DN37238_c0_g1_i1:35-841(+)